MADNNDITVGEAPTFTQEQLQEAFDKVKDPADWKNPIDAVIDQKDIMVTNAAISHFTGTVIDEFDFTVPGIGNVGIKADGYRMGPVGDQ